MSINQLSHLENHCDDFTICFGFFLCCVIALLVKSPNSNKNCFVINSVETINIFFQEFAEF